jgi:hypothetical protein
VRIRKRERSSAPHGDGFLRFFCPCGRRLKVNAEHPPTHGKCPDCGRVVPVPSAAPAVAGPDDRTLDLGPSDVAVLEQWSQEHRVRRNAQAAGLPSTADHEVPHTRVEVGLRVCPACGKPVHLGAAACRNCGAAVPRR